jgi:hypothetical protein
MCSFFRWANPEFHIESPMKNVPAPRFQKVEIEPFTREEVSQDPELFSWALLFLASMNPLTQQNSGA